MSRRRRNAISGAWAARSIEMMESPAYRVLSLSAHRALSRIEIEFAHHGGQDNGKLPVTFDDFAEYGVRRHSIGPALAELKALGFIRIMEKGTKAHGAEYRRANQFLLMSRPPQKGIETRDEWRRFKTIEEAEAAVADIRKQLTLLTEKKKAASAETALKPVPKRHRTNAFPSAETALLCPSAETALLSISRVREASSGTPNASAVINHQRSKLEWRAPVVTETRVCEACGEDLSSRRPQTVVCSNRCRVKAHFWRHWRAAE